MKILFTNELLYGHGQRLDRKLTESNFKVLFKLLDEVCSFEFCMYVRKTL